MITIINLAELVLLSVIIFVMFLFIKNDIKARVTIFEDEYKKALKREDFLFKVLLSLFLIEMVLTFIKLY